MDTTLKRQTTSNNLKSTPQSAGSAAKSKDPQVHVAGPSMARDVEMAQRCGVDLMLKSFILDCMVWSSDERSKLASSSGPVAKFFWNEVSRVSEPEILKRVYEIAKTEPDVRDHVPVLVKIFLDSHLALWKNGVCNRPVGVLNDFDLATLAQASTDNERTGTVPFTALRLLTKEGQAGEIKHIYAHDAESFIWVLLWVCARYGRGVLRQNAPFDAWLRVDVIGCRKEKIDYLIFREKATPGKGHEKNWLVAQGCLNALKAQDLFSDTPDETCDGPYELLAGPFMALRKSDE